DGHVTGVQTCALPIFAPRLPQEGAARCFGSWPRSSPERSAPARQGSAPLRSVRPSDEPADELERLRALPLRTPPQLRRLRDAERSEERRVGKECSLGW